ncbi:MAG: hypothetical protein WBQ94_30110, partial [Terracidiphilus sp.]
MRIGQVVSSFAGFALMLGVSQAVFAQISGSVSSGSVALPGGVVGTIGTGGTFAGPMATTGAPYTAIRKTTRVQRLANGTTITHV